MSEVWIDGRFEPAAAANVPSLTGDEDGLFETIRVRGGAPERLGPHLDRLIRSARALGNLPVPVRPDLKDACSALPARLGIPEGRMRVALVRSRTAVTLAPFEGYPREIYTSGATAALAETPGHPLGARAGHKVLPYTALLEARDRARAAGADEVLFHAPDGALLEGSASNVFVVRDGALHTPPLGRPVLPGVVRAAVLDAARALGIAVFEQDVFVHELERAEEVFLTGSLLEVAPLRRVGNLAPAVGPVARDLREAVFS